MQATTKTVKTIHLALSEDEARWLQEYVRNYLGQGNEPAEEYNLRRTLFEALFDALK